MLPKAGQQGLPPFAVPAEQVLLPHEGAEGGHGQAQDLRALVHGHQRGGTLDLLRVGHQGRRSGQGGADSLGLETILGAFEDRRLVGHVAYKPGWIEHFYVDPERHSRGIGTLLLARVKEVLPEIQLWTFQANAGARRFYERHGFEPVELTDGAGNEEGEPDVRYRWRRPAVAASRASA